MKKTDIWKWAERIFFVLTIFGIVLRYEIKDAKEDVTIEFKIIMNEDDIADLKKKYEKHDAYIWQFQGLTGGIIDALSIDVEESGAENRDP